MRQRLLRGPTLMHPDCRQPRLTQALKILQVSSQFERGISAALEAEIIYPSSPAFLFSFP
jgi:hypothetical protein